MAESFLSLEAAQTVREAIRTDGTFTGTPEWLDEHGIEREEFERFLDFACDLAAMYEWRSNHESVPPMVEAKAIITKGTLDKKGAKLTVEVRGKTLSQVEPIIEEAVLIQIFPEQMPLPMDMGEVALVDTETGEVIDA